MEDVKVAYIPFNYVQQPEEEIEKLDITTTLLKQSTYPEGNVYTVTYEENDNPSYSMRGIIENGGPKGDIRDPVTLRQAVWIEYNADGCLEASEGRTSDNGL